MTVFGSGLAAANPSIIWRKMGFATIGDVLAQPRAPLTLRFGPQFGRRFQHPHMARPLLVRTGLCSVPDLGNSRQRRPHHRFCVPVANDLANSLISTTHLGILPAQWDLAWPSLPVRYSVDTPPSWS